MSFLGTLQAELQASLEGSCSKYLMGTKSVLVKLSQVQKHLLSSKLQMERCCDEVLTCAVFWTKHGDYVSLHDLQGLATTLAFAMASENAHAGHSAGRGLLAFSNHVDELPFLWSWTLHFLWDASNAQCMGSINGAYAPYKQWTKAMRALEVLHAILRSCKEGGSTNLRTFLAISEIRIADIMSVYYEEFLQSCDDMRAVWDSKALALGALLRLLCSVIHTLTVHHEVIEKAGVTIADGQILTSVDTLVSAISCYCLTPKRRSCISQYLHYKFLMLVFRLHEWFPAKPSLALTCLKIFNAHTNVLFKSLFEKHAQSMHNLVESPFAHSLKERTDTQLITSQLLCSERHATFLLFKTLMFLKKISREVSWRHLVNAEEQCVAMERWVLDHIIAMVNKMGCNQYMNSPEMANTFATCFLQIFTEEDQLMLEVLLFLFDFPDLGVSLFLDASDETLVAANHLVVKTFHPLRMFIAFVSMVCYDHSVILDFLIAKHTGVLCLQYLVRCLRLILRTWPEILSLSPAFSIENLQSKKEEEGSSSLFAFNEAMDIKKTAACLLCLKDTIHRLHRRRAFPYNPSPLLSKLHSFQQLWLTCVMVNM